MSNASVAFKGIGSRDRKVATLLAICAHADRDVGADHTIKKITLTSTTELTNLSSEQCGRSPVDELRKSV